MFQKAVASIFLCTLLIGSSQASTLALKEVFAEYAFTVQVDGDEAKASEQLKKNLEQLRAEGIPQSEIVDYAVSQMKDAKAAAELRETFSLIQSNKLSGSAMESRLQEIFAHSSMKGASWDSGADVGVFLGLAVIVGVAWYLIDQDCKNKTIFDDKGICN